MKIDKEAIRQRALALIATGDSGTGPRLASEFGVSRQVANGYLQGLVKDGLIVASGSTRARTYKLIPLVEVDDSFSRGGLEENRVWETLCLPHLEDLPGNVTDIWHYGVTEMINNAIDHSGANTIRVSLARNGLYSECAVVDDGEGIFLRIQRAFGLDNPREAILELAKGKLTTDPANHSGEGIFFSSRAMDEFHLESGALHFRHADQTFDRLDELDQPIEGTQVRMRLANHSERQLKDVFDAYTDPEEYTFDRTVLPMRLAQQKGQKLISRSQAKRIANRFERFKRVQLDFSGVEFIGQAFADELFRVYANAHPDIRIVPINTDSAVDKMIRRVINTAKATEG